MGPAPTNYLIHRRRHPARRQQGGQQVRTWRRALRPRRPDRAGGQREGQGKGEREGEGERKGGAVGAGWKVGRKTLREVQQEEMSLETVALGLKPMNSGWTGGGAMDRRWRPRPFTPTLSTRQLCLDGAQRLTPAHPNGGQRAGDVFFLSFFLSFFVFADQTRLRTPPGGFSENCKWAEFF